MLKEIWHQFSNRNSIVVSIKLGGLASRRPDIFQQGWVRLDWVIEKNNGEVELFLVARYSQTRPKFPKRVPVKVEKKDLTRVGVPGLIPIPIRK